jgi:hypothetical protein
MAEKKLRYHCTACGTPNDLDLEIPIAPELKQFRIDCKNCQDLTHVLMTRCPKCKNSTQYLHSDLDFTQEILSLSGTYVELIKGIKNSLSEYIQEFNVPVPKRWTVQLTCSCGEEYSAHLPLPQIED